MHNVNLALLSLQGGAGMAWSGVSLGCPSTLFLETDSFIGLELTNRLGQLFSEPLGSISLHSLASGFQVHHYEQI